MTACKAIAKLLKLNKILKIVDFRFCRDGSLRLDVKPFKNGARCRECGRRSRLVRRRAVARQWRDLPVAGREVSLGYVPREIMCPTHGRTEEDIPWAARHARVSYRFEYAVLRLCQVMTQKAASELLHMSASTLSDQLHRSIERYRHGHRVRGVRVIGIDEVSYHKRHKYATLVYDLERSVVVWFARASRIRGASSSWRTSVRPVGSTRRRADSTRQICSPSCGKSGTAPRARRASTWCCS